MPKLKTHTGAARRFNITGSGKVMRTKGGKSHLRRKKPQRVRSLYDETMPASRPDAKRIRRLIPHGIG